MWLQTGENTMSSADNFAIAAIPSLLNDISILIAPINKNAVEFAKSLVKINGKIDRKLFDKYQHQLHGLSWYETYIATLNQTAKWAQKLHIEGKFTQVEANLCIVLFAEYLADLKGGIAMTTNEKIRPHELGIEDAVLDVLNNVACKKIIALYNQDLKTQTAQLIKNAHGHATIENTGLDETLDMVRDTFYSFAQDKVTPFAHEWHLKDELIPIEIVQELADLGVFGLTLEEEYGGSGLGKQAMCVVSEELSRGYIGVGSLGTRSEIAAELIINGGTEEQKQKWLPKLASGEILPTAVFTEPNTGSDLGSLQTRGVLEGEEYVVTGNKTWITHAARADLMTLLVRTNPETKDFRGLSMLLAEKKRGTDENPFPTDGMTGGEIEVLGYRGMKEYELGFDGFKVPKENLLGGVEGMGFKHLMATFESARIQTAARAIGVAQCALDLGLKYALERKQFGDLIFEFPRVHNKLVSMAAELVGTRQLTYFAALEKDTGVRCDLEAGMAKLLAARVAWSSADNALQIHGGNGFALEYPISRVLCDARILNIFEGAGEIQAQVIARRLLEE
ncbi:MAG: acyl-CoA/acyl-ACP dehydrogenase [Proteobacteria bacterium]|nr:acyl-CoA/acyl-ACP dehydrogenase [Pseudomonadota bacterium]